MRLLDRYLLRELLIPFSYCLVGFLIFWISSDVFAQMSEFQKERLKLPEVLEYYAVKMPEMMVTVLPIAFLLALLYALTNHARHHELTAIRAAGVSLARIALPYWDWAFCLVFSSSPSTNCGRHKASKPPKTSGRDIRWRSRMPPSATGS